MQVTVDRKAVFKLLDTILPEWEERKYPYNRKDAVIPQTIIPKELRDDKYALACFYFYICIYMRGGIESLQAFNAMLQMQHDHPELFIPLYVQWIPHQELQEILKEYIGWDSRAAAHNWIENSRRLVLHWKGDPLNLIKGLKSYTEACRRIRNKKTKGEIAKSRHNGVGFVGFQYKMVSMLLYFYDWEEWLEPRFPYPSPADFHNFRLGIAAGAIKVTLKPGEMAKANEKMSRPWRLAIFSYIIERGADPVKVSDALWLRSLVQCGNSPLTLTKDDPLRQKLDKEKKKIETLMTHAGIKEEWDHRKWAMSKTAALKHTCFICPFVGTCRPVPARPYYTKGLLVIREPLKAEYDFYAQHLSMQRKRATPRAEDVTQHHFEFPAQTKPAEAP